MPAYDDIRPLAEACYHGAANYAAVAGFLPEGQWTDVDLVGAYTTCMAAIRLPDWDGIEECRDPHMLADLDRGITVGRVRFRFPDGCRYPNLPVRAGTNGLLFPLEGTSCCTGPEIRLALDQGAEITVERGVIVPWVPGSPRPFAEFTRHIGALRKSYPKGSVFELLAKEAGNSLYGKLAQGIYPDGAEARDGGIVPGRAASGKRVFNSRRGSLERIPPSKITQALLAAYVTGLCRAVLGELVARLPAEVTLATATTDGLLVDGGLDRLDTSGPLTQFFAGLRSDADRRPHRARGEARGEAHPRLPHARHGKRGAGTAGPGRQADPGPGRTATRDTARSRLDAGRHARGPTARRQVGRGAGLGRDLPEPHLRDPAPPPVPYSPAPAVAGRQRPGRGSRARCGWPSTTT